MCVCVYVCVVVRGGLLKADNEGKTLWQAKETQCENEEQGAPHSQERSGGGLSEGGHAGEVGVLWSASH